MALNIALVLSLVKSKFEKKLGNPTSTGQILSSTKEGVRSWINPTTTKLVTQASHSFSIGNWVYRDIGLYRLADASYNSTSDVVGVVTGIVDSNVFVLTVTGAVYGFSGLKDGYTYFLSDSTPGLMVENPPTLITSINKPLFIADSDTSGFIVNMRGMSNSTNSGGTTVVDTPEEILSRLWFEG